MKSILFTFLMFLNISLFSQTIVAKEGSYQVFIKNIKIIEEFKMSESTLIDIEKNRQEEQDVVYFLNDVKILIKSKKSLQYNVKFAKFVLEK